VVGLIVEATSRLARHRLLGDAVRVHDLGPFWPSYGMLNFDASSWDSLQLRLHTGLTPNPGSGSYNSAYEKKVTLLEAGAPRPMVSANGSISTCTSSGTAA
jgi:hypothetical protein